MAQDYSTSVDGLTGWPEEIEEVLSLLKLFPAKAGKRSKGKVEPFIKAIDKLITHSAV